MVVAFRGLLLKNLSNRPFLMRAFYKVPLLRPSTKPAWISILNTIPHEKNRSQSEPFCCGSALIDKKNQGGYYHDLPRDSSNYCCRHLPGSHSGVDGSVRRVCSLFDVFVNCASSLLLQRFRVITVSSLESIASPTLKKKERGRLRNRSQVPY
jgi:hypothetical protein